jgi:hypothetical protein
MTLSNEQTCLIQCFLVNQSDICQTYRSNELGQTALQCSFTLISMKYLFLFPLRYLQCVDINKYEIIHIYYRNDGFGNNLINIPKPLLFYPLDHVSGINNLGSLNEKWNSVDWVNGKGYFDCSLDNKMNQMKMLRLNSSDNPWLRVIHNISSLLNDELSVMIWFKKSDPLQYPMPLLEGMSGSNNDTLTWHLWNYPNLKDLTGG